MDIDPGEEFVDHGLGDQALVAPLLIADVDARITADLEGPVDAVDPLERGELLGLRGEVEDDVAVDGLLRTSSTLARARPAEKWGI